MPCITVDYDTQDKVRAERELIRAALCMMLTIHGVPTMRDWYVKAGINKQELVDWWNNHQAEDARRKKQEQVEKEKQELKRKTLAKLTPAERKALGLK